jgi:hypothetical protein
MVHALVKYCAWRNNAGSASVDEIERLNRPGYIPALFLVAVVLWHLVPKGPGLDKSQG